MSAAEFLCKEFCEAFGSVFEQTAGTVYALRKSGSAESIASGESLCYALEFSGKVSGTVFVTVELHSAAVLATALIGGGAENSVSYLPEHEDALFEIVSQTAGVMATSLRTRFGTAEINVARKPEKSSADCLKIKLEPAESADPVSLLLVAEQALCESINAVLTQSSSPSILGSPSPVSEPQNLRLIMDVELNLTLRFGQRILMLSEVADLATGSVVELDRAVDEPVELLLGERVIARGEVVIVDGNYGLRITEIAPIDRSSLLSA